MIYITVGNHFKSFTRLLKTIDKIALEINNEFIAQTGDSDYNCSNIKAFKYIQYDKALDLIRKADIVISHAGIGTIINAKQVATPIILLARTKKNNEHFNNHQLEIINALKEKSRKGIYIADTENDIKDLIIKILENKEKETLSPDFSGKKQIQELINEFITNIQ